MSGISWRASWEGRMHRNRVGAAALLMLVGAVLFGLVAVVVMFLGGAW